MYVKGGCSNKKEGRDSSMIKKEIMGMKREKKHSIKKFTNRAATYVGGCFFGGGDLIVL